MSESSTPKPSLLPTPRGAKSEAERTSTQSVGDLDRKLRSGDDIEVQVESLAYGGKGVARWGGMVVFVERAAPGDRAIVRILKRKQAHCEARIVELLEPGTSRVEPPCALVGRCGGCSWQHLPYEEQLAAKVAIVRDSLERLGGLRDMPPDFWRQPFAAPSPWHYRNKMDFGFGFDGMPRPVEAIEDGDSAASAAGSSPTLPPVNVGFHRRSDFRRIIDVPSCLLHPEPFDRVLGAVREWAREYDLPGYNPRRHTGLLRNLIVRHSATDDEIVVVLLTKTDEALPGGGFDELAERLRGAEPRVVGLVHGLNAGRADTAILDAELGRWGRDWFTEQLGTKRFRVNAFSFFQTNTRAAALLYDLVRREAELTGGETLVDAFCGAGTIGLYCGDDVAKLYGLEIVPQAIADARANAALNGLGGRAEFLEGDVRHTMAELAARLGDRVPDRVILDPPRGGIHQKALKAVLSLGAPRMIYVSCNPTTLARDLDLIREAGYRPLRATPVDLFPQTYHIELVVPFVLDGRR
jgi:23S rRNA (uracil1939-C5)-methyltransferase